MSLTEQLGSIDDITAQTVPMLLSMVEDLQNFVAADLPFKQTEREARLEALVGIMQQPNVTAAEQYRLIMDAYQAEMEYYRVSSEYMRSLAWLEAESTLPLIGPPLQVVEQNASDDSQ